MDANDLKVMMNERGYYIVINIKDNVLPEELNNRVWTSEREALISVTAFLDKIELLKQEKDNKKD